MKKPIKIYFDRMVWQLVITNKKLIDPKRYAYISSHTTVPNAELRAEQLTENDGDIFRPSLDIDLADSSFYDLSEDDKIVYCVSLA